MTAAVASAPQPGLPRELTLSELLAHLGDIPARRVRTDPPPGTATEEDLLSVLNQEGRPTELIDGILVEKPMAAFESGLAGFLIGLLMNVVRPGNLGMVTGERGPFRLRTGLVREPDVAFISRARMRARMNVSDKVAPLGPDLAVEVLSEGNTDDEMARKRREYFAAGTRLVWIVNPPARTVEVFTAPEAKTTLREGDTLTGGEVLPGFTLAVSELFAEWDRILSNAAPEA
jgi:Uma2 family endonuclease